MRIPFHKMNLKMELKDLINIEDILTSGQVVNGKYTYYLEEHIKTMCKVKYAIACTSCTAGLTIALDAGGFTHGKVSMPAFTWPSTFYAARNNNNVTVFCDVNYDTWLAEPSEEADLIIAVDTFGSMIELETDTPVIYDAAHGFGLDRLGNRGIAEVVSFSYTKAVTGMQGGVILTNDGKLARKARKLVNLYAKLTEINSYICLKSIEDYNANCIKRWDAVEMYCSLLDDPYQIQEIPKQTNLSVFSILLENKEKKDRVAEKFIKNGIEVKIYYKPLANTLENTNQIYRQIISLPTWDGVEKHIPEICEIINNA